MIELILGLVVAFNILIVVWKFQHGRIIDAFVDGSLLVLVALVFSGSTAALIIGAIGSFVVSIYLLFKPVKGFSSKSKLNSFEDLADRLDQLLS